MDDHMAVIRQQDWSDDALIAAGFRYYPRRKQLVLARELPPEEAPKTISAPWATLVADAGEMICYNPSYERRDSIDEYEHWPVNPAIFEATYKPWDEPERTVTPAEMHLLKSGCKPYYKTAGAWAKRLTEPVMVQSMESPEPIQLPVGAWLLVGVHGEPWGSADADFKSRYVVPEEDEAEGPSPDDPAADS
jgi:hypothetical protein